MLISTIKPNEIVTMKIVTGEEIITKLIAVEEHNYRISKPLVLSLTPQGPAMTPFLLTAELEAEITLPKTSVVALAKTETGTSNQYIKGTTGIEPATTSDFTKLI